MLTKQIQLLFNRYLKAFKAYDMENVKACYHLPCTLNTPDKVVLLSNEQDVLQEFNDIFTQLKQARTENIVAKSASYTSLSEQLILVCINWDFFDDKQQIFADFSALYHLLNIDNELKIVNVVSHELNNSLALAIPFELTD